MEIRPGQPAQTSVPTDGSRSRPTAEQVPDKTVEGLTDLGKQTWESNRETHKCRERDTLNIPLSILDLAPIRKGQTATDSFKESVALAKLAESSGYKRVWYAEHHNMATIASSATSVVIAHIAAHTSHIRLGAGGVMLPNHSPLTIAEQFGTLESMHPGRIDLGLGRAPGSDQNTMLALRRGPSSADHFPQDVLELQGYLSGETRIPGVQATPGRATFVPLYILGSSMFGAGLAAALWGSRTGSLHISRPTHSNPPSLSTGDSSNRLHNWTSPTSSPE
jgi:hypothetical protein